MNVIQGRKPESVFRFFEEICAIPHPSFHEERIADYLVAFARARGLEYDRDELHNVLIKKPATPGREQDAPLLFQGHTDMVCEKNGDVEHDFLRDPLKLFVDGDLLGAEGTTLGGDDGIAVAMMLAMLDGELVSHPALECLFTSGEEVGLDGACAFDASKLCARTMINLDSEDLGVVTAGCAGGLRSELTLSCTPVPFDGKVIRISVRGLMGGHSGQDINSGRANANKLMGRLLASLTKQAAFSLISLCGGSKDNAIPRECEAVLSLPQNADLQRIASFLQDEADKIKCELIEDDRGFVCTVEPIADSPATVFSAEDTARAVAILSAAANGVFAMNRDVPNLVEFSRNLGVIHTEGNAIVFVFSSRSSMESYLDASINELDAIAAVTGCKTRHHSRYPGWVYAPASAVREAYLNAYRAVTGTEATVNVIHAGLECGVFYSKIPDMDMISVGPTMHDIHSPNERLDLSAVETFWKTLVETVDRWS
ncbi:MAG: aminoacyl-histidine dipeptidase [Clostridia bacterium]|nr:aminoacyl-histidine dipeptidase [Clostridia bacterium]